MTPTPRALLWFFCALSVALLPTLGVGLDWRIWLGTVGLLLFAMVLDALLAVSPRQVRVELDAPLQVGVGSEVDLRFDVAAPGLGAPSRMDTQVATSDLLAPPPPGELRLSGGRGVLSLPVGTLRRGEALIKRIWLAWTGPLGLVRRQARFPLDRKLAIVPELGSVRETALRWFTPKATRSGLKVERYMGDGTEFDALREYVAGLDPRRIDWTSTARHRRLICRENRAERNHQVVLALDTGHLMRDPLDGAPKLDHAISTALVLGYVALRTGERVGLFTFDAGPRTWLEPRAGVRHFARLQHATAAVEYSNEETNYTLSLTDLSGRLRRRSLVLVLTDFVDSIGAELMVEHLLRMARRHLVVLIALRDPWWSTTASQPPVAPDRLYESVVAADFVREREFVMKRLERAGIITIDASPREVTATLLNRYLELRRREQL